MFQYIPWSIVLINIIFAEELPSFVRKCSVSSPRFQSCIKRQIPDVIEGLKWGYPELGLVPLEPFEVPQMSFDFDENFNLKLTMNNLHMEGLTNVDIERVFVDPEDDRIELTMHFPKIYINTDYTIRGNIASIDVDSIGPAELHFANVTVDTVLRFYRLIIDGTQYYKVPDKENFLVDLSIGRYGMRFENLVRNNAEMTEFMNNIINNNFHLYFDMIKEGMATVIRTVVEVILSPLLSEVPIDNIFEE